jgi:hypothetical protein
MQLELADNFLSDMDNELTTLPALDPNTGEIYAVNMEAMALLSPEEQAEVFSQAPFIIQKISEQSGNMDAGLFSRIKEKVNNFKDKMDKFYPPAIIGAAIKKRIQAAQEKRQAAQIDPMTARMDPMTTGIDPMTTGMTPGNPKFSFSASLEPDPKPWFARPEVLLPVIGGVVLIGAFALRRKR